MSAFVIDLSNFDGDTDSRLDEISTLDHAGRLVSAAGDVNGNGLGDEIIGARYADLNGHQSGSSYILFGRGGANVFNTGAGGDNTLTLTGGSLLDLDLSNSADTLRVQGNTGDRNTLLCDGWVDGGSQGYITHILMTMPCCWWGRIWRLTSCS